MYTDFLNPKALIQHLYDIETTLNRDIQALDTKEFSKNIDQKEKMELSKVIEKIEALEKSANKKIGWANEFSKFLKVQSEAK